MPEPEPKTEAPEEGDPDVEASVALLTDDELDERMAQLAAEGEGDEAAGEGAQTPEPAPAEDAPKTPESEGESGEGEGQGGEPEGEQASEAGGEGAGEPAAEGEGEQASQSDDELTALKARIADLETQNTELQTKYDRTGNELGQLRTRMGALSQPQGMSDEQFDELLRENPRKAIRLEAERLAAEAESKQLQSDTGAAENRGQIERAVPDLDKYLPAIGELLKSRGISDRIIADVKADPYDFQASEIIGLANEARLLGRVEALEIEREQERRKRGNVAKKIEEAANERPGVSASSGQAAIGGKSQLLSTDEIAAASDEELEAKLQELRRRELG